MCKSGKAAANASSSLLMLLQFLLHFAGYLLLEVSQTILIWLHSDPQHWNGPGRASQEILGVILALLMLLVEILDYSNWSREAYHRRLTMTVHKDEDPPLYPIPGESHALLLLFGCIPLLLVKQLIGGRMHSS